jgi:hypothetical protein
VHGTTTKGVLWVLWTLTECSQHPYSAGRAKPTKVNLLHYDETTSLVNYAPKSSVLDADIMSNLRGASGFLVDKSAAAVGKKRAGFGLPWVMLRISVHY